MPGTTSFGRCGWLFGDSGSRRGRAPAVAEAQAAVRRTVGSERIAADSVRRPASCRPWASLAWPIRGTTEFRIRAPSGQRGGPQDLKLSVVARRDPSEDDVSALPDREADQLGRIVRPCDLSGGVHRCPRGLYRAHPAGSGPSPPRRRPRLLAGLSPPRAEALLRGLGDVCGEDERPAPLAVGPAPPAHQISTVPPRYQCAPFRVHADRPRGRDRSVAAPVHPTDRLATSGTRSVAR